GGSHINPSGEVVRTLTRDGVPGVALHSAILPVDRQGGPATLLHAVRACQPDAILCLGEAARRTAISIERVAINLLDYRMADNAPRLSTAQHPRPPPCGAAYAPARPGRLLRAPAGTCHARGCAHRRYPCGIVPECRSISVQSGDLRAPALSHHSPARHPGRF